MMLEHRMFRQMQRDAGNPYKEESRQWLAWAKGYTSGQIAMAVTRWNAATGENVKLPRPRRRSDG